MNGLEDVLREQREINQALLGQMKQMQSKIEELTGDRKGKSDSWSKTDEWNRGGDVAGYKSRNGTPNFGTDYEDRQGGGAQGSSRHGGASGNRIEPYKMNMLPVKEELGEWDCPKCGNLNWAKRDVCNGWKGDCATAKKPEFVRRGGGVWDCSNCGNMNRGHWDTCKMCFEMRPGSYSGMGPRPPMGGMGPRPPVRGMGHGPRGMGPRPPMGSRPPMGGMGPRPPMGGMGPIPFMGGMGPRPPMGPLPPPPGMMGPGPMGGEIVGRRGQKPGAPPPRPGDWECPRCYNVNFHHRSRCNGSSRDSDLCNLKKPEFEEFKVPPIKHPEDARPGDWDCWRCGAVNYGNKFQCFKCRLDKDSAQDENLRK